MPVPLCGGSGGVVETGVGVGVALGVGVGLGVGAGVGAGVDSGIGVPVVMVIACRFVSLETCALLEKGKARATSGRQ